MNITEPFPAGVLPEPLKSFVREGARAYCCDPAMLAIPALVTFGQAVGGSRVVRIKRDWLEPCVFWAAIIGESGSGKSPGLQAALRFAYKIQSELVSQHENLLELHQHEIEQYEKDLKEWSARNRDPDHRPVKPQSPEAIRLIASDTTIEALAPILKANPRGILIAVDELAAFLKSFDAYRSGKGGDAEKYLSLFNRGTLIVDRKHSGSLYVPHACASIVGTIQPQVFHKIMGDSFYDNGLAARMLLAAPPRRRQQWSDDAIEPDIISAMERLYGKLLTLGFNSIGTDLVPVQVPFTACGMKAWVSFYNRWKNEESCLVGHESALWTKLTSYCARFALLVHLVREASDDATLIDPDAIDAASVAAAVALVTWFGEEAQRIYAGARETEAERLTRQLVELVRARGGTVTVRELQRSKSMFRDASHVREELQSMAALGLGKLSRQSSEAGGRPREIFELNPELMNAADYQRWLEKAATEGGFVSGEGVLSDEGGVLSECDYEAPAVIGDS